jgi:hypothetical protein
MGYPPNDLVQVDINQMLITVSPIAEAMLAIVESRLVVKTAKVPGTGTIIGEFGGFGDMDTPDLCSKQ